MKDRLIRMRKLVKDHPYYVSTGVGFVAGSIATLYCIDKNSHHIPDFDMFVNETRETLAEIMLKEGMITAYCDPGNHSVSIIAIGNALGAS